MSAASRFVGASLRALGLSTVLAAATASAAPDDAMPPRGDDDVVLVPYEAFWAAMPEANRGIVLSYAEYRELVDAARASRGESEPIAAMQGGVLESAVYSGRVGDDRAEVEGDLILRLFSNHPAAARLGLVGAALLSATLDGQPIAVGCNAKGESVLIATGEGTHRVRLSFSVALQRWAPESGTPGERLAFNAPRATSASLSLVRRGTFEVRTLSPWARPVVSRDGGDTRVEMAMGGESPVDLVFSPGDSAGRGRGERMLRLGEEIAMRVDASTLVLDAALTVESESPALEWEMPGQDGARFTSVRGGTVSSFASGGGTVRIRFREAPRVGDRIDVHIERAITPGSATDVMPLAVTSAARASGSMTIAGAAGVRLTVESTDGLVEEPAAGERRFRFFGAGARARLRVDALATRFNVDSETIFGLEEERTLLVVLLTASVVDGKLFHLDYPIPAGFRLRATNPPATHDADRVTFLWPSGIGAGQTATGVVTLEGDRIAPPPAVDLPIPLPVIAGAERSAAVVSVVVESSLRVEERDLIGITVRDPQTLRLELVDAGTVSLALRAIGAEARGTLHVERRPRRESATVLVHHAATRERIDTEGLLSLTVSNEPVESFTIALPAGYTEFLDVESEDGAHLVREKERIPAPAGGPAPARDRFRIGFEGKLRGTARFRFRFQRKLDSGAVSIELPEVAVENVERETGSITIEGADELELGATTTGLEELDVALAQPLPGYVLRHNLYAAFGYARHPYSIRLAVKHFPSVAVPPAVVDRADVRIAVSSDGIYEAEARYRLLNSSRQFLRVALPDGASLESAIVDGLPVKPARDRGALLVPVPVSKDAAAIDVRLFYEGRIEPLGHAGSLVAQAPALDVLVAEGGFEIFLPHGYRYLSLSEPGRPEKAISDGDPILLRFLRTFAVTSGMPLGTRSAAAPSIAADEDASLFQRRESDVSEQVEHKLQALGYVSDSESKRKADAPGAGGANEPSKRFGLEVPRRGKQAGLLSLAISLPEKGVREAYVDAGPVSEIRVSYLGESFERILFALLALFQAALSLVLRRFRVARMPVQLVVLGALYTWIPTASIVHVGPGTTLVANALFVGVVGAALLALAQWMAMKRAARIAALGAVATLLALVLAPFASADDVKAPAKPRNVLEGRTVVPFDPTKPRVPGRIDGDEKVFVPESRFRELWLRAHPEDVDLPAAFVEGGFLLSDATYEATWIEDHVLVRALLTLTLLDERATAVPLPFTGVALSSARLDDSVAPVTGAERGFVLYAKGRGAHRIALEFAVPTRVMGSGESRRIALAFGCPAIAAAQVRLTLAGVSGRVEFRNACGGQSEEAVDSTRVVTGFLGDRTTVDVVWSVSAAKERESVTPFDARIAAQVRVQPGTLLLSEDVTLRIPDPGLESVEFDVPRDLAIIAIEGKLVGAIDRATGSDRMRVHFVEPATGDVTLRIRGEVAIASTDGDLAMPLVRPRNGRRIEGTLDVADDPSLTLDESGRPHNLERVAADGDGVRRYAFSMADVELRMRLSVRRAEADLAETLAWSLGADVRRLDATWRVLAAERGPVTLTVSAPPGFRAVAVTGPDLVDWIAGGDIASPTLVLRFQKRLPPGARIAAVWTADAGALPESLIVRPLAVVESRSLRGTIRIDAGEGLATRLEAATGVTAVPIAELAEPAPGPGLEPRLGFRFESAAGAEASLVVDRAVARLTVETLTLVTVEPHRTFSRIELRYDATGAPVSEVTFQLPALSGPQPEITAAGLRRVDVGGEIDGKRRYHVVLQAPRLGRIAVSAFLEEAREADSPSAPLRAETEGAEVVARFVVIFRGFMPGTHGGSAGELLIDESRSVEEMPVAEVSSRWQVDLSGAERAYRVRADDGSLRFRVVRHAEEKLLDAIIDDYSLTVLVLPGSEIRERASFRLQNRTRQYLELTLPDGSRLLSAFVGGRPVKAVRRTEKTGGESILLPLRQSSPGEVATTAEVVISMSTSETRDFAIAFPRPRDIPVSATHVKVIGPRGSTLDVDGNLEEIVAAIAAADTLETLLGERQRLQTVIARGGEKEREVALENFALNQSQVETAVKEAEAAQQLAESEVRRMAGGGGKKAQVAQSQVASNEVRVLRLAEEARKQTAPVQRAENAKEPRQSIAGKSVVTEDLAKRLGGDELDFAKDVARQTPDGSVDFLLGKAEKKLDDVAAKSDAENDERKKNRALVDRFDADKKVVDAVTRDGSRSDAIPELNNLVVPDEFAAATSPSPTSPTGRYRLKHAVAEDVGRTTGEIRAGQWRLAGFEAGLLPLAIRLPEMGSVVTLKKLGGDAVLRVRVREENGTGTRVLRILGCAAGALILLGILDRLLQALGSRVRWRRATRA